MSPSPSEMWAAPAFYADDLDAWIDQQFKAERERKEREAHQQIGAA